MKKILSLSVIAAICGVAFAFTSKPVIDNGWYFPDYTENATPTQTDPGPLGTNECPGGGTLCATHYSSGSADATREKL